MLLLQKLANCYKELNFHREALASYKKVLQLAWSLNENKIELETYDLIGMQYYYLENLDKARYYHTRMMKGILEPQTYEKSENLQKLQKSRKIAEFKRTLKYKSIFENYNENGIFLENNKNELLKYFN